jgi:hypothetical protein
MFERFRWSMLVLMVAGLLLLPSGATAQGNGTQAEAECDFCHDYYTQEWGWVHSFAGVIGVWVNCATGSLGCHPYAAYNLCGDYHNSNGCGGSNEALRTGMVVALALELQDYPWALEAFSARTGKDSAAPPDESAMIRGCGGRLIVSVRLPTSVAVSVRRAVDSLSGG